MRRELQSLIRPAALADRLADAPAGFAADHFSLFGFAPSFRIDVSILDKRFRERQSEVHPDRFVAASESERRLAMQWSTRVNEAYRVLKNPLARARYLLELAGDELDLENNTLMPSEFLLEQMEWREAAAEARQTGDAGELEHLRRRIGQEMETAYAELAKLLDERQDYQSAADRIRRLMFLEKLRSEIDDAIAALDET